MSDLKEKINSLLGRFKGKGSSYGKKGINPIKDWKIYLTSTFVCILLIGAYAFYFYTQIDQGKFFLQEPDNVKKEVKINNVLLKKVVEDINLRKDSLKAIGEGKGNLPDPSL